MVKYICIKFIIFTIFSSIGCGNHKETKNTNKNIKNSSLTLKEIFDVDKKDFSLTDKKTQITDEEASIARWMGVISDKKINALLSLKIIKH